MNLERLEQLETVLKNLPDIFVFDMRYVFDRIVNHPTITIDIAGLAQYLFTETEVPCGSHLMAAKILDLDEEQADALFFPPDDMDWEGITALEASYIVMTLRHTGVVSWSLINQSSINELQLAA